MSNRLTFKIASELTNCTCSFCKSTFAVQRARPCLVLGEKTVCMKCVKQFGSAYEKLLREFAKNPLAFALLDAATEAKKSEVLLKGTDRMAAYTKGQRERTNKKG